MDKARNVIKTIVPFLDWNMSETRFLYSILYGNLYRRLNSKFEILPTWFKLYSFYDSISFQREHFDLQWICKKSFAYYEDFLDTHIGEWTAAKTQRQLLSEIMKEDQKDGLYNS